MGENGAGKSTLAKVLAGVVKPDNGRILMDGEPVRIERPLDAQRCGIGIIFQELDLFPHLTVGENMVIANLRFQEAGIEEFCRPFLEQVGLARGVNELVRALPIGERQLLAIARALSMDARVILMDEPTSSLFDDSVERLFRLIRDLKTRGVSVVYVSHKMDEIFHICDRATVLRDGQTVDTIEIAATSPAEIIRQMVGRDVIVAARPYRRPAGDVVLAVDNLTTAKLRGVSFELRRSEVLGIAGLVGSGRTELGAALFGLDRVKTGSMRVRGEPLSPRSPRDAMELGIGFVPEDRRLEGLMMNMSVLHNGTIGVLEGFEEWGFVRSKQEMSAWESVARRLAVDCASPAAPVRTLSGGNQQKVLFARWLLLNPDLLFLDDPTRGVDVGAKQDVYRIIDSLAAEGKGIMLVSSELPELLRCCDRILVLCEGRQVAVYDAREATQEQIMTAATNFAAGNRN